MPGEHVLELIPGGGYFERIFSVAIGPDGRLIEPSRCCPGPPTLRRSRTASSADPHYGNISEIAMSPEAIAAAGPYDLIWTSQNYHDLHLTRLHLDIAAFDKAMFNALKPGGYSSSSTMRPAGLRHADTDTLHRIDADLAKQEMKAAGFVLEAESDVLRNPADDHTLAGLRSRHPRPHRPVRLQFRKP